MEGTARVFTGGRRSSEDENARADNRSDTKSRQAPRPERFVQPLAGRLGIRDESVNALGAEQAHVRPTVITASCSDP